MAWSQNSNTVEFCIEKEPFAEGGFPEAYKARSKVHRFKNRTWVLKKNLESSNDTISESGQTLEQHTRKTVQMHMLSKNFALHLEQHPQKEEVAEMYGQTLRFDKVFLGKMEDGTWVTIEEFIEGVFVKNKNNNGILCGDASAVQDICESLTHFSFECSNEQLMVVDMLGSGYLLYDPEIASKELKGGDKILFSAGNLSTIAINNFIDNHVCNDFCALLGLKKF